MQHWVLCEILNQLSQESPSHLLFACSHSMAPWSIPEPLDLSSRHSPKVHSRRHFDSVRQALNTQPNSRYEDAWKTQAASSGIPYPSSAVFAERVWPHQLSLLLCEANKIIAGEINAWLKLPEVANRLQSSFLHEGDWRSGLSSVAIAGAESQILFAEFDPMRFEHHPPEECNREDRQVIYSEDIEEITAAFEGVERPIVLQISSYSANNSNPHSIVEPAITQKLESADFSLHGKVEADRNMISLVYVRGISLWDSVEALSDRFHSWRSDTARKFEGITN
jgi:hypothetical protein